MGAGWIRLERSIQNHWIWHDEKYFRWWITILLNVNHESKKFPVNNEIFICNPGESFRSIDDWGRLFGCAKKTVFRFFELLKNDGMITTKTAGSGNRRKHLLTVVNWQKYQQSETENDTERKPETTPKGNPKVHSNKNDNNDNNEKQESFNRFWDLYGKKVDMEKCFKKWGKLTEAEKEIIFSSLPTYVSNTPEKKFRKNPLTYLNGKCWNDDPESNQNQRQMIKNSATADAIKSIIARIEQTQ